MCRNRKCQQKTEISKDPAVEVPNFNGNYFSLILLTGRITVVIHNTRLNIKNSFIPIYIQQDATLHSLFISGNCSTRFGWYLHPSSGAHTAISTASGICQTVSATCH
jgi:hypothetical protein